MLQCSVWYADICTVSEHNYSRCISIWRRGVTNDGSVINDVSSSIFDCSVMYPTFWQASGFFPLLSFYLVGIYRATYDDPPRHPAECTCCRLSSNPPKRLFRVVNLC